MWARNLLFVGLAFVAVATLGGTILTGDPQPRAREFRAERYQRPEFLATVAQVNAEFADRWQAAKLEPAPRAEDLTIARRLSLGLAGTIPSLEEIRKFEKQPSSQRIGWWVDHLLADRRSSDYLAERFARAYVGVENGPFLVYRRRRFLAWLSDELHKNTPYDNLARQLIAGEGLWTSKPEVNFVTATIEQGNNQGPNEVKLAARVTRAFLGVRLDCVECHDDNLGGDWKQTDFHELAAFFSGAQMTLTGVREKGNEYRYKYLHAAEETAVPIGAPFEKDLLPAHGSPRERLAAWATHRANKAFARATVNRVWALMLGQPLVEPIDNIPLAGPYPPGLETLADDFVQHGHDLQRLIRLIAATDVFQRASHASHEITPRHEVHLAAFPLTRLRPDQVSGSILQAARLQTLDANSHIFSKLAATEQQTEFIRRYGDMGEDEFSDRGGTIPQRLLMMNGFLVRERTKEDFISNAATRIAQLAPSDATAIEVTYLTTLSRRPSPAEQSHFAERLAESQGGARNARLEDLQWTLLNSTEFSWNH